LRTFRASEALAVLPAEKGNATAALDTADYNQKIAAHLEDHAYKKLKDRTESVELKTVLLLNKSSISVIV
jgi:hypothetical protein